MNAVDAVKSAKLTNTINVTPAGRTSKPLQTRGAKTPDTLLIPLAMPTPCVKQQEWITLATLCLVGGSAHASAISQTQTNKQTG